MYYYRLQINWVSLRNKTKLARLPVAEAITQLEGNSKGNQRFCCRLGGRLYNGKEGRWFFKVKGSGFLIPKRLMFFFTSSCSMAMGFTQALTEMRTSSLPREQSAAGA
jgi:hypothetical protein